MENKIKVSVVLAMHNLSDCIRECLDSLISQTFRDFEIICVDDGSEDGTAEIVGEYIAKDSRITLLNQQNLFAGTARNNGLEKAVGEYVMFPDADDFFQSDMLEKVCLSAEKANADIVITNGKIYDSATGKFTETDRYLKRSLIPESETFSRKNFPDKNLFGITDFSLCNKLFRKSFIGNLKFQTLQNTNDVYFVLTALSRAEKITVVDENLINHRINRPCSVQSEKKTSPYCFIEAYEAVYNELVSENTYNDVEWGLVNCFVSACANAFKGYRDNTVKISIANRLKETFLCKNGLMEKYDELFSCSESFSIVKSFLSGIDWAEKQSGREAVQTEILSVCGKTAEPIKVSVIVPVYNVEKYLAQCLDSLTVQTLNDIEIICVNDGSTDNSPAILRSYAEQNSKITLVDKQNGGLSSARNAGLRYAKGEYVYFIDSDDYIDSETLEQLYKKCAENNLDAVYFDGESFFDADYENCSGGKTVNYVRRHDYSQIMSGVEYIHKLELYGEYQPSVCLQMIKRELLEKNGISFYNGILHEDNLYTFSTLLKAERVTHVPCKFYHRRYHSGSIVTAKTSFNHCYGYFVSYIEMLKLLNTVNGIDPTLKKDLYDILYRIIGNAKNAYMKIPVEEKYWFNFLSSEHYYQFLVLVYNPANAEMGKKNYKAKYAGVRDEFNQKLNKVYGEKSLLNQKLQQTYREKSELNEKLKLTYSEKSQLNAKLQQTYKEKSEINAKLQQTYKEKSEINKNLRETCEALESSSQQNAQLQQKIDELQQQLDHPTFAYLKGKLWDKIKAKLSKK